jgi:NADH dehydrogenase
VNNIAWALRRFPVFPIAGDGRYAVQPVSVADTARIAVEAAGGENAVLDAAGPDLHAFEELVGLVRQAVGSRARAVHAPAAAVLGLGRAVGLAKRDVLLTAEELAGLRAGLLVSDEPPLGRDRFVDWVRGHADELGRSYVSELARNFRPYRPL